MSKSILTLEKEVLKKEYAKSPLGIAEKKLRSLYDGYQLSGYRPVEETMKQVDEIRTENERRVQEYVDLRQKTDKEAIDDMLLEAFTKEITLLESSRTTPMNDQERNS